MLVIFGPSRGERVLAALPRTGGHCGHPGPQILSRRSRRVTSDGAQQLAAAG